MFGWFRKQQQVGDQTPGDVVSAAADETLGLVANICGALGGMPRSFAEDPFVLGVIGGHAAISAQVIAGGKAPITVSEDAMVLAVTRAFPGTSSGAAREVLGRLKSHPELAAGNQAAKLLMAARFGRKDMQSDPILVAARRQLEGMPAAFREAFGSTPAEQLYSVLLQDLVVRPLQARIQAAIEPERQPVERA